MEWGKAAALPYQIATGRAALPRRPSSITRPRNLMDTSEIRPILGPLHQSRPHRILAHVLPLLAIVLAIAQLLKGANENSFRTYRRLPRRSFRAKAGAKPVRDAN